MSFSRARANGFLAVPGLPTFSLNAVVEVDVVECQGGRRLLPLCTKFAIIKLDFVRHRAPHPFYNQWMTPQLGALWVFEIKRHIVLLASAHQLMHSEQ